MGVSNPVKYVLRLSLFTNKRTEQQQQQQRQHRQHHSPSSISPISPSSTWKGKEIDFDPPIEVRWGAVQYPEDYAALTDGHAHMAVSAIDSHLGSSNNSSSSSSSSRSRSSGSSSRTGLVRIASWASLAGDRCRWTMEQERKLAIARSELARCQKAWSSEQELWIAQVCFIPFSFLVVFQINLSLEFPFFLCVCVCVRASLLLVHGCETNRSIPLSV